ncbi:unnamed protein product [Paramecium sonneborni]|uniref:Transmembrane protein n=1 Tax=Paramecium sonneborni TaxID=65129 RepID=A0A8S1M6Z5_9CILI|nr:unnamed protein product [Paramecium sonneborni]
MVANLKANKQLYLETINQYICLASFKSLNIDLLYQLNEQSGKLIQLAKQSQITIEITIIYLIAIIYWILQIIFQF